MINFIEEISCGDILGASIIILLLYVLFLYFGLVINDLRKMFKK